MAKMVLKIVRTSPVRGFAVALSFGLAALAYAPAAEPVVLAEQGAARMPVVVAAGATPAVRAAAADLARTLARLGGAAFVVTNGDGLSGVAVGVPGDFPAVKVPESFAPEDPFRRDEYVLRSHANGLWVLGATEDAVVLAVWDLLYRLGYRLYFLTDTWEIAPRQAVLSLAVDVFEQPDYITRQAPRGAPWSDGKLWDRWRIRNRVKSAFELSTGHAYDGILERHAAVFEEHPEYLGLVGGKRRGNKFCVANPELRKLVVDDAVAQMRANPGRDSLSMEPSDGGGWCECPECAQMGSVSDRVVILSGDVAEAINALGLGPKYVGIYAYAFHSPPPNVNVHPKVIVSLATSFIRGGFTIEKMVEGWRAKKATLGIRDYHGCFVWDHDLPRKARGGNVAYLTRTIPYFHANGARFMNSENGDSWGANGLGFWLTPRFLWNTNQVNQVDALVEDFLEKCFGPAKEPMRVFFQLLNFDRSSRTPEDVRGRMYKYLAEASALNPPPEVQARLDDLILYTRYIELYYLYRPLSGDARQIAFTEILRHTWRIRDRNLLSTMAIVSRERYRDGSVYVPITDKRKAKAPSADELDELLGDGKPTSGGGLVEVGHTLAAELDKDPWDRGRPYTPKEVQAVLKAGVAANKPVELDFEPIGFSEELVPARGLGLKTTMTPGSLTLLGRGTRRYLVWLDEPGEFEVRVTGGLIAHYRDRGNVKLALFSPLEETFEPVSKDASVPPDGEEHVVTLRSPYPGLHTLQVSDGGDKTALALPPSMPVTVQSSMEEKPPALGSNWTLYFYVPKGTRVVGGFANTLDGVMRNGLGDKVFEFKDMERVGYFKVPVAEGQDGACWKLEACNGQRLLMTVPPYLAADDQHLLVPREVVEADGVR
jgi:hypothetical protein